MDITQRTLVADYRCFATANESRLQGSMLRIGNLSSTHTHTIQDFRSCKELVP